MSAFATGAIGVGNGRPLAENLASALVVVIAVCLGCGHGPIGPLKWLPKRAAKVNC